MHSHYPWKLTKHLIKKLSGKPDPFWALYDFEQHIHPETLHRHEELLLWAEESLARAEDFESEENYRRSTDPIVQQGYHLKKQTVAAFRDKLAQNTNVRLLIQVPDPSVSPGGFSLLSNFAESFTFIGIPVYSLGLKDDIRKAMETFAPTVLLVTDHEKFRDSIDWDSVDTYRLGHSLTVGLSARLEEEEYGNSPLTPRLAWAKEHGVDFYFSYRDEEYIHTRKEYRQYFDRGYQILTIPFGANPLHYYPVPSIARDINYSMLASGMRVKGDTYTSLAKVAVTRYPGFIDGIGWQHVKKFNFTKDRDRYIYARSKIGLNFHLPEQREWACEVNERTHQLAMCGVPQILDAPKLLSKLYSEDSLFSCHTGKEFLSHFEHILEDPSYGQRRALKAQREAFERHTTFHRAESFINQLTSNVL